jgi:formylglycine-generating enzyme required for sulfatase activity
LGSFWIAKYELTKRQFEAVMGSMSWSSGEFVNQDLDSPAVMIATVDVIWEQGFIPVLNELTGKTFSLPSEAQWEYACRAGTTTRFYWGDDPDYTRINDYSWWYLNAEGERYVHVVGQKLPNPFGLFDMSGNAYEVCLDTWHSDYTGSPTNGSAWVASTGNDRVIRGGSVDDTGEWHRSASRWSVGSIQFPGYYWGFRLVRNP